MKSPEALRIIDANLNRVREALRVVEDIIRFSTVDKTFQAMLREIRHSFTFSYMKYFDTLPITKRSVVSDAGRKNLPYKAKNIREILYRNFLRIEEGIRCIEECSSVVCPESTPIWQRLRFKIYEIEQQVISRFPEKSIRSPFLGMLLPGIDVKKLKSIVESAIKNQIDILVFQAQEKSIEFIEYLRKIKSKKTILLIVNRPDIALITNIDGVYLDQTAIMPEDIRAIMPGKIIGIELKSTRDIKKNNEILVDFVTVENKKIKGCILTKLTKKSKLLLAGIIHSHHEVINTLKNGASGVILKLKNEYLQQAAEIIGKTKKKIEEFYYGKKTRTPKG